MNELPSRFPDEGLQQESQEWLRQTRELVLVRQDFSDVSRGILAASQIEQTRFFINISEDDWQMLNLILNWEVTKNLARRKGVEEELIESEVNPPFYQQYLRNVKEMYGFESMALTDAVFSPIHDMALLMLDKFGVYGQGQTCPESIESIHKSIEDYGHQFLSLKNLIFNNSVEAPQL